MELSAKEICELLNGELTGDPSVKVSNVSRIDDGKQGTLSFLANPKYTRHIYETKASIVIVNMDFEPDKELHCTLIKVEDPYQAFAHLLEMKNKMELPAGGVEPESYVSEKAKLGDDVYVGRFSIIEGHTSIGDHVKIYPQVFIGKDVIIGDNTIIFPGVKIYSNCFIGRNCVIHSGAIIGSDGFGFAPNSSNGEYKKIPQVGNVIIEDNVEIGANTTIDRATMGSTIIREGVKLDNLIQIAHNVEIGENSVLAAQVGIAGSSKIGKECMVGGQVGISGHLKIADNVKIGAQAGIASSINTPGETVIGSPSFNYTKYHKSYVYFRKLPELNAQIENLEKELTEIKKKLNG